MAREALREAFKTGDDPYEFVEMDVATRLGGVMLIVAALVAITVPSVASAVFAVLAVGAGVAVLRRGKAERPQTLLAATWVALFSVGALRYVTGDAPYEQLLFLVAVSACVIHPIRTSAFVLVAATVIAWSPLAYEGEISGTITSQLMQTWTFGLIVLAWMARVRQQRAIAAAESSLARIDALTGLQNRRALEELLPREVSIHRRNNRALSVLVCDMDDFKGVNDNFGHQAGDDLLRKVAQSLTAALRLSDPCFRWGGDEFVAVLPEAGFGEASDIAARVRETVALSCRTPDGRPVRITVGAAQLGPGEAGDDLVRRADEALLAAKAARPQRSASGVRRFEAAAV